MNKIQQQEFQPNVFLPIKVNKEKKLSNLILNSSNNNLSKKNNAYLEFFQNIDVLVDGRFILEERDLSLLFRGSRNQRLIDMPKTLETGRVVLFDEHEYNEENKFERVPMYV